MEIFDRERLFSVTPKITIGDKDVINSNGKTQAFYYDGEPYNGKITRNFAYIGFPKTEMPDGGYPAIIVCHGGGGCAFPEWVEYWTGKGYVCVAPDLSGQEYGNIALDGQNKAPKNPDGGPSGYKVLHNDLENYKDGWLYHSVCNVVLVNNILRADARVNPDKIALTGISWGSVITMITSGVDDRLKAFAPVYGGGYLHNTPFVLNENNPPKDEELWLKYFDPTAYLQKNFKPTMFTCGLDEPAFSVTNNKKSWDLCRGEKTFSWRRELRHYHRWKDQDNMINVYKFIDKVLNGNEMPFDIEKDVIENDVLRVKIGGLTDAVTATLCYSDSSTDMKDNTKIEWKCLPVQCENNSFEVKIPDGTTMAVLQISDGKEHEFVLSSKLHFI